GKAVSKAILGIIVTLLLGLMSIGANAGVIYRWNTISADQNLVPTAGQLEVDDAAWRAGMLDFHYAGGQVSPEGELAPYAGAPDSPLLASRFSVEAPGFSTMNLAGGSVLTIDIFPRTGESNLGPWLLDATLYFDHHNGILTGDLYANNSESDYLMGSS